MNTFYRVLYNVLLSKCAVLFIILTLIKDFRPGKDTRLQLLQNGTCGDRITILLAPCMALVSPN